MVNNEYFLEVAKKGIPDMIPESVEYIDWWKEQKDRCINGYWVGDTWMPGRLYWYVNFWKIEIKEGTAKHPKIGHPFLRDIEWEFFPEFEKARGFSGFDKNKKPLYENDAKGILVIGNRGPGKSFWAAGIAGHEYTFYPNSETIISAYETAYSKPLLNKVKIGLNNIDGASEFGGVKFPAPFTHRRLKNNFNSEVKSGYVKRENGVDYEKGYRSKVLHRVFMDNPLACNGLRPSLHIFEEVGIFQNLMESYNSSYECWMNGSIQFGSPFLLGTGGEMDKGTVDVEKMFYEPEAYNLISFENTYDQRSDKIAYFIPNVKGSNQFKDENGVSDVEKATEYYIERREKKKKSSDLSAYYQELQYQPFEPKEAFLLKTGNIFPTALIQDQIEFVLSSKDVEYLGQPGQLDWAFNGGVKWEPSEILRPLEFPIKSKDDTEGCIVIWEHPPNDIPYGMYVAGTDPVDHDESLTSSLASTFIYKRFVSANQSFDTVVAEYTGRPQNMHQYYETIRKLLTYYNCKSLYENMITGMKQYFQLKATLHLLKEQPSILDEIVPDSKVHRAYGIHMVDKIKLYAERMTADWLMEEYEPGKHNVRKIYSLPLLNELLKYYNKGNFDRVIAFMLCLLHDQDLHKVQVEEHETIERDMFFTKGYKRIGGKIMWA